MQLTLGQQYNVGEKPTVILCIVLATEETSVTEQVSHRRISHVLATEETSVTQQVSHRRITYQSRLWSQRGTKVNGSHHAENPLLRPIGIQIATKSYATLQGMTRLMSKRFIKPLYSKSRATSIDSDCCRLPTASVLSNKTDKLRSN